MIWLLCSGISLTKCELPADFVVWGCTGMGVLVVLCYVVVLGLVMRF